MYQIRGIVGFYNHVRQSIAQPMDTEQKTALLDTIRLNVQKIEKLCNELAIEPNRLPARSRIAYYYLKNFDGSQIVIGTSQENQQIKPPAGEDKELSELFQTVYSELTNKSQPRIVVNYYPYSSLKSTIRNHISVIHVRLCDMLKDAPLEVKRALATILLCKLEHTTCPSEQRNIYRDYINSPEMHKVHNKLRQTRGMKIILGHEGRFYNLEESFRRVNMGYFSNQLSKPNLTWSERKTHRLLGHEDESMNTIVISKSLDSKNVPMYVLDYIMYHELLHIKHGSAYSDRKRRAHTKAFREDEKKFNKYKEATQWLKHHKI